MVAQISLIKMMLGLGAIATSLIVGAAPAWSQVSALDILLEQAESSDTASERIAAEGQPTEQTTTEQVPTEQVPTEQTASLSEREAAMQVLTEALAADGITDRLEPAKSEVAEISVNQPGAGALSGLESAQYGDLATDFETKDLATASATFAVNSDSVPALQAALNSDQALTRLYAADALWTLTGDSDLVLPTLMQAATSSDADIQELAVVALGQMGSDASPAVPILTELLNKKSRTRVIAQNALTVINSQNRSGTALGIIARESRRWLLPAAIRAVSGLWR